MKTYIIVQKTSGYINYAVVAESEEDALKLVMNGDVDYDCHDYDVDETFVDHIEDNK